MKKILYLTLILLISIKADAFDKSSCPATDCPADTFMGDDGKCYHCNEEKKIEVYCIGKDSAEKSCPNRIVMNCAGLFSERCPEGSEKYSEYCCIDKEKGYDYCTGCLG